MIGKRETKEIFWIGLGQFLSLIGGLLSIRILSRTLGTEGYGVLALIQTVAYLAPLLLYGPLAQGLVRFYSPAREDGELRDLGTISFFYVAGVVVLTLLLSLGAIKILPEFMAGTFGHNWLPITFLAFGLSTLDGYSLTLDGFQNAARQRIVVAWHQSLSKWSRFGLAYFFMLAFSASPIFALLGFCVASAVTAISQTCFLRILWRKNAHLVQRKGKASARSLAKKLIKYSAPFVVWGAFGWAQTSSDKWTLEVFTGSSDVGIYAALLQIGYAPLVLLGNMVMQFISPIIYERIGDNTDDERRKRGIDLLFKSLTMLSFLSTILVALAFLLYGPILRLFTPQGFWPVSYLLPYIIAGACLFNAGQLLTVVSQAFYFTKSLILPKLSFAASNIALNVLLGKRFAVRGVVIAMLVSSLLYAVWMALLTKKQINRYKIERRHSLV